MGPTEIGGVPAHPLLVHMVVTLVPLGAVLVLLAAVWPTARRRLAAAPPVVALLGLLTIPPTTHAGEALQRGLNVDNPAVSKHADLGSQLLPWSIALVVVSAVAWALQRRPSTPGVVRVGVSVLAVVAAVGTAYMTYRIGSTGAEAVWDGVKVASS